MRNFTSLTTLGLILTLSSPHAHADEGMWLFNQVPKAAIAKKYGFTLTDQFARQLQLGSVRFNNGGSGSFVSGQGLLFTNHHVGMDCIQKVSSPTNDYVKNGFSAATRAQEKRCPDLEINILQSIDDVTAKVNEGLSDATPPSEANQKRKEAQSRIEKECVAAGGERCDVVTLYAGGLYHLYRYKKYTDVRLVFAPESSVAAFGGDPDNFTYPRYCLDVAFFRAYDKDQPVVPQHFFPWSRAGAKDKELTFVSGHPGSTGRLATMTELEYQRDVSFPMTLSRLRGMRQALDKFMATSAENKRAGTELLNGVLNSLKAIEGFNGGLHDEALMARKREDENKLKKAVADDPAKAARYAKTWDEIAAAYERYRALNAPFAVFERSLSGGDLMGIARDLVRYTAEKAKPNPQRLREYSETALPAVEQRMFSDAPVSPGLEVAMLENYFTWAQATLGAAHPAMEKALAGRTPRAAAEAIIAGTKLADIAERKRLAASAEAVQSSSDPLIQLLLTLDAPAREVRKRYEDQVEASLRGAATRIAQIRFAMYGDREYPDATFTLRLSYGQTLGYKNAKGQDVPWSTVMGGIYPKVTGQEPFALPKNWLDGKSALNLKTPYNFVSTHDTHGGNSGSPTLNTRGEIVGILFDGNLEGLPNRYVFTDSMARSVHVASQGILESLRKIYRADSLVKELTR
ncbi:MAG: S46 family peptidase [Bryobacteraceae bacterium]|nr:S46 family peptidase [Bryobacteraceae bacterium]